MKKFKNSLTRNEMKTIFAGGRPGTGTLPFSPECGEDCSGQAAGFCSGGCNKCEGGKCAGL